MREVIRSFFITVLLGYFTVVSAQLPPEIMVDKHLIHAEQLYAAKDYAEAFNVMEKIIALQKEHNLALPDEFHFKYAQVALSADSLEIALESVTRYLSATGKEGEFYKEALSLMLKAEGNEVMSVEDFYNEVIKTQGTCDGLPVGSSCWMEMTNHPECYVWNADLKEGATMIWSGRCSGHLPEGKGTLTGYYIWKDAFDEEAKPVKRKYLEHTGPFQRGKAHGKWVENNVESGVVEEGPYLEGKRHGKWVMRDSDGNVRQEGSYVDGKKHGEWVEVEYGFGTYKSVGEGPYVEGGRHGKWVMRSSGLSRDREAVEERPYVDGKRHGQWVERYSDGTVFEGTYIDDKAHGKLVIRYPDGIVGGGAYVDGKKHGEWIEGLPWQKDKGRYINGEKEGTWLHYYEDDGDCMAATHNKDGSTTYSFSSKEKCRQAGLIP